MRKRITIDRSLPRPARAVTRPATLGIHLQFEPLEERRLLAGVPELLAEINPGGSSNPAEFVNTLGTVFFSGDNGTNGSELWKTDGSSLGTLMVKDIAPLGAGSSPTHLTEVGGTLFFAADDGINGVELWKSDGTSLGTTLVKNINSAGSSLPAELTNINGTLYFRANDGTNGAELWKSDGTELGTTMVMDIAPAGSSDPRYLTNVGGSLFFSADNGFDGRELWLSDPIGASTAMVKDINPGGLGSSPGYFDSMVNVGGVLFFSAFDAASGFELWKSDGTLSGTTLVKDVNPGANSSFPFVMANASGTLFFTADNGSTGFELWKSDGTSIGTTLVKDINPVAGVGSVPDEIVNVGGTIYFRADDGTNGVELWKSNGTLVGTEMVSNINASGNSSPRYLTNVNGTLFFRANQGASPGLTGTELWKSDGTPGGTVLAIDIAAGEDSSNPSQLVNVNGTLLFSAESTANNQEPWIQHVASTSVAATRLFYNNSAFDLGDPAANAADDAAIATNKVAYLPNTGLATFANVSSYSKGINGVMFDLAGTHGAISAADLTLQAGSSNTPGSWPLTPAPLSVTVRAGAGVGGSDRVTLIWANNAIQQKWLQVTVKANFNTNLAAPYAFLFGNAVADSGQGNSSTVAITNSTDQLFARNSQGMALVTTLADYNRDGFVNSTDELLALANPGYLPFLQAGGPPAVMGRHLFYNQSVFDGGDPAVNISDDLAIATDKSALLPGASLATFGNISSYSRGINGIMLDLAGSHPGITVADFTFRMGNNSTPSTWTPAPSPSVLVRPGAGVAGSDRVVLTWNNGDITNTWIEVVVADSIHTGLAVPDVFYFGSRIGDTGSDVSTTVAVTNSTDEIETRNNQGVAFTIANRYDFDRDGIVGASDQLITRNNGGFTAKIEVPNPPGAPPVESLTSDVDDALGDTGSFDTAAVLFVLANRADETASASNLVSSHSIPSGEGQPVATRATLPVGESGATHLHLLEAIEEVADVVTLDEELLDELIAGLRY